MQLFLFIQISQAINMIIDQMPRQCSFLAFLMIALAIVMELSVVETVRVRDTHPVPVATVA